VSQNTALGSLYCFNNHLYALDLSSNTALTSFDGSNQTVEFTLYNNGSGEYEFPVTLNNPVFTEAAISYAGGTLSSSNNAVASTHFDIETNLGTRLLSGEITFTYSEETTGIVETGHAASLRVYPNPTKGQLIIENGELTINNVEVYDVVGRLQRLDCFVPRNDVSNEGVIANEVKQSSITIDVSGLPSGMYFLKVDGTVVKFVKH
jgi:hypothetical protein